MERKVEENLRGVMDSNLKDSSSIGVYITIFIGLLTAVILLFLWKRGKINRRSICLVGLCDAGKTLIFTQLIYDKAIETFSSMKENIGFLSISSKGSLKLIDVPGHERVRQRFFDSHKSSARGIVFVIDSNTLMKDIRDVAEYLYLILSDPAVHSNRPPVLVLCNKQDHTLAKGEKVIKTQLEKEMNVLRTTKTNQLEAVSDDGQQPKYLGKEGKDFEFEDLKMPVVFKPCSAQDGNIDELKNWLHSVA
nr:EOG090X0C7N [Polyphemus pediculus]